MEDQDTTLQVLVLKEIDIDRWMEIVKRIERTNAIVDSYVTEVIPDEGEPAYFDMDLKVDRPLDQLVAIVRGCIPENLRTRFALWRQFDDEGEEVAVLYADPLPGLFNG